MPLTRPLTSHDLHRAAPQSHASGRNTRFAPTSRHLHTVVGETLDFTRQEDM